MRHGANTFPKIGYDFMDIHGGNRQFVIGIVLSIVLLGFANSSYAALITCGSAEREAGLDSAVSCVTGTGNSTAATTDSEYPRAPYTWTTRGDIAGADGTDDLLTVSLTAGSWGSFPAAGTWAIDSSFWTIYAEAAISLHVGNGDGDPDHWTWLITPGETSGTWSYEKLSGGGGGLSNLHLYGVVPEPSSAILLVIGLSGLALATRRGKT